VAYLFCVSQTSTDLIMGNEVGAIILDMDGLMLDTEPLYKSAWQAASTELGYALDEPSYAKLVGRPNDDCERELVGLFGIGFPLDKFRARWPALWKAEVAVNGIQQKAGLLQFLAFLDGHGLPVAVATSSETDYAALSLRNAGLEGRFKVLVTSDEVARGKPAPDIYLEAARRMQVSPSACVALGGRYLGCKSRWHARPGDPGWDGTVRCGSAGCVLRASVLEHACGVVADLIVNSRSAG
jgi:beta-phosphoglucomutase